MNYQLTILIFCSILNISASIGSITGIILDSENKEPLSFTNIVIVGQNKGTVSNIEGQFILDLEGISQSDTILFSYVGYETLKIRVSELQGLTNVYLQPVSINIREIQVYNKTLTADEIVALVYKNYEKNYLTPSNKQRIFFHKYIKASLPEKDPLVLKKSDFIGLDNDMFNEVFRIIPRQFIDYQDALVDLYSDNKSHKLDPIKGVSLEEGEKQNFIKELDNKISAVIHDFTISSGDTKIYYNIRTGILSKKFKQKSNKDSIKNKQEKDTLNHTVSISEVKKDILDLFNDYTNIECENWEFINNNKRYRYSLGETTIFNDELVYKIFFTPKRAGLFEGLMYVSTISYAILQLDFNFVEDKKSKSYQFLGVGHSIDFIKGRIIFEKGETNYYAKYIYAQEHESFSIERNFSIIRKQKRFLGGKKLNEIKFESQLFVDKESYWEILVLDREEVDSQQIINVKQPQTMKFKKEFVYTPEMWNNSTVIAPSSELKKYKRK